MANYRLRIGWPVIPSPSSFNTALIGDSLTDKSVALNRNWSPFWWTNGLAAKGAQKLIFNAGVNGDTVGQMLSRVNNLYTNASPGLAGLGQLGIVEFRGGTNDARALTAIGSLASTYTSLLEAIKSYSDYVIIRAVPPMGSPESNFAAKNALTLEYNTWLQSYAASNSGFIYVADDVNLRNPDGSQISTFFSDGVHNNGYGTTQEGVDSAIALSTLYDTWGYVSPLVTDPADVYPTTQQLVPNHLMVGTAGTAGTGFTGSVADDWTVAATAAGTTGTCSKVAADGGDSNSTVWQRVTVTQVTTAGQSIRISIPFDLLTLANTSNAIEMMFEIRFNAFNSNYFSSIRAYITTSSGDVTNYSELKIGGGELNQTLTVRTAYPRSNAGSFNFPQLRIEAVISANFTGSLGSFDIRNVTARQE